MRLKLLIGMAVSTYALIMVVVIGTAWRSKDRVERYQDHSFSIDIHQGWTASEDKRGSLIITTNHLPWDVMPPDELAVHVHNRCLTTEELTKSLAQLDRNFGGNRKPPPFHFNVQSKSVLLSCVLSSGSQADTTPDSSQLGYCTFPTDGTGILFAVRNSRKDEAMSMIRSAENQSNCSMPSQ